MTLKSYDPGWVPNWVAECEEKKGKKTAKEEALEIVEANRQKLVNVQELFWANDTYSMLIILQGMDAAGKDGVISHVMSGVNPQGCEVHGFRTPSEEELNHDFLWRYIKVLPERGRIGIFNRSYYEDVLIVKVRPEVLEKQKLPPGSTGKDFWKERYEDINLFEQHLVRNGTVILKFFLNISKEKQKQRLLKRLEDPDKTGNFPLRTFQSGKNGTITWKHTRMFLTRQAPSGHHGMLFQRTRNGFHTLPYPKSSYRKSKSSN